MDREHLIINHSCTAKPFNKQLPDDLVDDDLVKLAGFEDMRYSENTTPLKVQQLRLLFLRLSALIAVVCLLTMHVRSLRMFRWEQSVSGGILVTYFIIMLGLCLCAGTELCTAPILQSYFCGMGAALFTVNAITLWQRWNSAGELTRVVTELLVTLGVKLRLQIIIKITLSFFIGIMLFIDFVYGLL